MGEHTPDIDLFPVVVNGNNQAIFVSSDIKDGEFLYLVCGGERDPQFCKRGVIGFSYNGIPMVQRITDMVTLTNMPAFFQCWKGVFQSSSINQERLRGSP
jgi:hypothetical protein